MTNSNKQSTAASASRRPRASTTIDRKRVARPMRDSSIISRNTEMVIKRPLGQARVQQSSTQSQTSQQQMQQMQLQQSSRPQYSQQAQQMQQQMMQSRTASQRMSQQQMQQQMMQQQQMQQHQQMQQQQMMQAQQMQQSRQQRLMQVTTARMQQRAASKEQPVVEKETAKQMKETAIEKALESASRTNKEERKQNRIHFGFKRVVLAMLCASVCVFAFVWFVDHTTPNVSLQVVAMGNGIDSVWPKFIPREYKFYKVNSEEGKVTMFYRNDVDEEAGGFTITEEASSWDSNALLKNYVRYEYGEDYTTVKEQGLTIYISASDAAWVNGGIVFKIKAPVNSLTKKQIKSIAVSLIK